MLKGNIKLVAISGAARSGKDTLAQALCGQFGYKQYSFAEPIYKMLNTLPYLEHLASGLPTVEKEKEHSFYAKSPRRMLQTLGTEWGRNCVSEDLWIWILEEKFERKYDITKHSSYVISDLRFPNEANWVRKLGGLVVQVVRDSAKIQVAQHVSENGAGIAGEDLIVPNDGTIEALCQQVPQIDTLAEKRREQCRS